MNARDELVRHIAGRPVKHIQLEFDRYCDPDILIAGTLESVLPRIDFKYDDGFGCQELSGIIWYEDGTWSDRREYDGSEWWEHQVCPELPHIAKK